ncbi:hypothetical protein C8Q70DRAFT_411367 [Cubamyces menziesii]|nr:hypothetical protein C8Q70DRAFT_411367 [Cubamyces menziesii]
MSHTLAPLISNVLHELPALIERTLRHETACQTLVAQCSSLAEYVESTKARIAQEKAAQRLLRAEIAAFLRERGSMRSASASSHNSLSFFRRCCSRRNMYPIVAFSMAAAADSLRAMEDRLLMSNVSLAKTETSLISAVDGRDESFDVQESPLLLKSKRNAGRIFSGGSPVALKRRRVAGSDCKPSSLLP